MRKDDPAAPFAVFYKLSEEAGRLCDVVLISAIKAPLRQ